MFRPQLTTYIDSWDSPDKEEKKRLHKTDYRNVLPVFLIGSPQRHLVAIFADLQTWIKTPGAREKVSPSKLPTANMYF